MGSIPFPRAACWPGSQWSSSISLALEGDGSFGSSPKATELLRCRLACRSNAHPPLPAPRSAYLWLVEVILYLNNPCLLFCDCARASERNRRGY